MTGPPGQGRRFQAGEIFVPEMLIAARAMSLAMGVLEPILAASGIKSEHTAVLGIVEGEALARLLERRGRAVDPEALAAPIRDG